MERDGGGEGVIITRKRRKVRSGGKEKRGE